MSSSAAISAANTAIAIQAEDTARRAECRFILAQFDSKRATVAEMHAYASCVQRLHPDPLGPEVIVLLKVMFAIALVGGVLASTVGAGKYAEWWERLALAFFGFIGAPMVLAAGGGIVYGIWWLFQ